MSVSQPVATNKPGKPPKMRKLHPFRGLVSGLALGIGLVILCVSFSVLVTTSYYVYVGILVAAVILGILVGLFGPTRTRGSVRRAAKTSVAGPIVSSVPSGGSALPSSYPVMPSSPEVATIVPDPLQPSAGPIDPPWQPPVPDPAPTPPAPPIDPPWQPPVPGPSPAPAAAGTATGLPEGVSFMPEPSVHPSPTAGDPPTGEPAAGEPPAGEPLAGEPPAVP